ncbi:hypothetical protein GH5_05042 [Leishmania sp. Ghana 2012 LV757]|uniref:hypothetical protein n=1 Tax=Leishmania sp. Ghana 2012 LV757 TaxID=2803181 RepID=UPI001B7243DA|nr:hypothetical protein GH5_05042 [Leishmania sp. Ghana 2012 LV757]
MRAFAPFSMNAVAVVRRAPHTQGARERCVSVSMVETQRALVASSSPLPSSLSVVNGPAAEDASAATLVRCEENAEGAAATPPAKGFRSSTRFKLSPAQVNENNVPSAREVVRMIPTLQELRAQLPDARELEQTYIRPEWVLGANGAAEPGGKGSGHTAATTASSTASLFQKATDPLEEWLFGPPKEDSAAAAETAPEAALQRYPLPRLHLLLAYRALFWGTVFALLGFTATVATAMYVCGYHSLRDLQRGVRGKMDRDGERLRAMAAAAATAQGAEADTLVEHYVIDLAHPTEAWRQVQEIWGAVQRLAEEEERGKTSSTSA